MAYEAASGRSTGADAPATVIIGQPVARRSGCASCRPTLARTLGLDDAVAASTSAATRARCSTPSRSPARWRPRARHRCSWSPPTTWSATTTASATCSRPAARRRSWSAPRAASRAWGRSARDEPRGLRRLAPGHRARGAVPARGALRRLRRRPARGPRRAWSGSPSGRPAEYAAVCASQPHPQTLRGAGQGRVGAEQLEHTSFVGEIGNLGCGLGRRGPRPRPRPARKGQHLAALGYGGGEAIAQAIEVTAAPPKIGRGRADRRRGDRPGHVLPLDPRPPGRTALGGRPMRVGVLGIGKTPHKIQHDKSLRDLIVDAGRLAMDDAGVEPDGHPGATTWATPAGRLLLRELRPALMGAHHLGLSRPPRCASRRRAAPAPGRCTWAVVAILSGLYDTVMVMGAEKMNDLATVEGTSIIAQAADSKEEYFSGLTFPSGVALTARKYMQVYGCSEEDLAHVSVKNHHYGARNPYAHLRFECTVEEVMRSAKVADPLKLYEVCPMTDAGSALVLCREEILRDQPDKPQVYVTATSDGDRAPGTRRPTPSTTPTTCCPAGAEGLRHGRPHTDDMDVAEIYNSFAIQEPLGIESPRLRQAGRRAGRAPPTGPPGSTARSASTCRAGFSARATRWARPARPRRSTSSSSFAAPPRRTSSARTPRSASAPAAADRARSPRSTSTSAWRASR